MNFPGAIGRTISRNALLTQKASPEILLGAGIVGVIGSTVLACRATLKMDEVLEESKSKLDFARTLQHEAYSESDRSRDISLIYFQSGVKIVRLYAPAIVVGGLSIAALTTSHRILSNRNTALAAAYSALDKGFREYRARVVDKYGEEQDLHFRYGTREEEIVDPDNPRKKKVVTRVSLDEPSIYARFFDGTCSSWTKDHPQYNLTFLIAQQNYWNNVLKTRGHVFLNEVYSDLGLPHSKEGAVVGWIWSDDGGEGDNYISFGVFDDASQVKRDFINAYEGSILLDFNVDGVIYDKI